MTIQEQDYEFARLLGQRQWFAENGFSWIARFVEGLIDRRIRKWGRDPRSIYGHIRPIRPLGETFWS